MVKIHKVLKADLCTEPYIHTKVLATICNCCSEAGLNDTELCQELAEVVTYYVYQRNENPIATETVFSVIKAVLTETGQEEAAQVLNEHQHRRLLKRQRLEVLQTDWQNFEDLKNLVNCKSIRSDSWSKSDIVKHLTEKSGIDRQSARTVAAMVEDKVFALGVRKISLGLLNQLILNDTAAVLDASHSLQSS
jgi:isopentenyldiphosphate isomerase